MSAEERDLYEKECDKYLAKRPAKYPIEFTNSDDDQDVNTQIRETRIDELDRICDKINAIINIDDTLTALNAARSNNKGAILCEQLLLSLIKKDYKVTLHIDSGSQSQSNHNHNDIANDNLITIDQNYKGGR